MTGPYLKPLPRIDETNRPHWQGAKAGGLRVQRCMACSALRYPPARWCPQCLGEESDWITVSGKGTIWSWCVFHREYFKGFESEMPYAVVLVELDEGPRIYSNMVAGSGGRPEIGTRVRAVFEPATDEVTLVKFEEDL